MSGEDKATIRGEEERREEAEGLDLFLEERLAEEVLSDLERAQDLEALGRHAAHITVDLQDRGPLYQYVLLRRKLAAAKLLALATIDPRDAVAIAQAQATVREYLAITEWIDRGIEAGKEAAVIIENEGYHATRDDQG